MREGIDTWTSRGYIVVAPTLHSSGLRYARRDRSQSATAPAWLVEMVRARPAAPTASFIPSPEPISSERRQRYAQVVLAGQAREVAATAPGARNHRLFRAWRRCGTDLADVLDKERVKGELTRAAVASGLDEREIQRVLR